DQGRGLERLARLLLRQLLDGQLAQLLVDQRQQLLRRLGVTPLDGREDAGHVRHRWVRRGPPVPCPRTATEQRCPVGGSRGPGSTPGRLASRLSLARRQG